MTFRLVATNVHNSAAAVRQALDNADYGVLNEYGPGAAVAVRGMLSRKTWRAWVPAGGAKVNPHVWRAGMFAVGQPLVGLLVRGGHRGLDDTAAPLRMKRRYRRRRLGPHRWATGTRIVELSTSKPAIIVGVHLPARTQTVERWRWPVMLLTQANLRRYLLGIERRYPGVPLILCGDMNLARTSDLKLGTGWESVATPADMGRKHYTQVHTKGNVTVGHAVDENTASDHDAIHVLVKL